MTHFLENLVDSWKDRSAVSGGGFVGRLDPRVRIIAAGVFAVVVVSCSDLGVLTAALGLAAVLAVAAWVPVGATARKVLMVDAFILVLVVMLPFTMPGRELFRVAGLPASWEGLMRAVEIALKANAVMLALVALVGTLETAVMGHGLQRLRVPAKLIHLFLFTIRYVEVLNREYQRLRRAMRARAFRPRSNLHTWRSLGYLLGMLLVRGVERSERILAAMKCRGFDGRLHLLDDMKAGPADAVFALVAVVSLGALVWMDVA